MKEPMAAVLRRRTRLPIPMRAISATSSAGFVILTMFCLPHTARAGIIYQTGFESSELPPYSTGQLTGNNGWVGAAAAVVENSTVFSGSQAVSLDSTGLARQSLIGHNLT